MGISIARCVLFGAMAGHVLLAQTSFGPPAGAALNCAMDGSVVDAITGEPIVRAKLVARGQNGLASTASDNAGRWRFTGLSCGQAQVTATRPGFLPGSLGQPRPGATFRPAILRADAPLHDVRIALSPQSVVTGKVLDEQGDPLMNTTIMAMMARVVEGKRKFQAQGSVNTNDLGEYRLAGLAPGRYIVCARYGANQGAMNLDGDSTRLEEKCSPGPLDGPSPSAMEISGNTARVDFTLLRIPSVRIRGTLTGASGRGVAVTLFSRSSSMGAGIPASMNRDGAFEFRGVAPGSYVLSTDYWEAGARLAARVPVNAGGVDIDNVAVRLEPGFSLEGTLRVDSKSQEAVRAVFSLRSSDPLPAGGTIQLSKNLDSFSIRDLTPGNYRLELNPNGPFYMKSAMLGGRDMSKQEVPLAAGAGVVEVVLSDDTGSLEGVVQDDDGKPASAWVMILPADETGFRTPRNVMSGADGRFLLSNIPPGAYRAYAWDDWQQVEYADAGWMGRNSSAVPVTVEAGQSAHVELRERAAPIP